MGANPQIPPLFFEKTKEKVTTLYAHCNHICKIEFLTMKRPKRTKEIKIRLTEQEHQILLGKKTGAELATWIRDTCLQTDTPKKKPIKTADPELLRQLTRIGGNLNQIAKHTNTDVLGGKIDCLRLLGELAIIREQLGKLSESHR